MYNIGDKVAHKHNRKLGIVSNIDLTIAPPAYHIEWDDNSHTVEQGRVLYYPGKFHIAPPTAPDRNTVYRLTYNNIVRELRETPNSLTEYDLRDPSDTNIWSTHSFGRDINMEGVLKSWQSIGWVVSVRNSVQNTDCDPDPSSKSQERHKCLCDWNTVYCKGCQCGGV